MSEPSEIEYTIEPDNTWSLGIKEIIEYKELLYFFAWRDIKVKYKQSLLGVAWVIIQPVIMMLIFTFIFGNKLGLSDNVPDMPYSVFVLSGLVFWFIFASGVAGAGNSMVSSAAIIKKIYFPRILIPLSAVLVSVFDFVMSFLVLTGVIVYYKMSGAIETGLSSYFALSLPALLLTVIATLGPGLLISALNVKYRDFKYLIPFMIQILLFLTPVIYPMSMVSDSLMAKVLSVNPMYAPVSLIKSAIASKPLDWELMSISMASSVLIFILGLYYFRRTERYFADIA